MTRKPVPRKLFSWLAPGFTLGLLLSVSASANVAQKLCAAKGWEPGYTSDKIATECGDIPNSAAKQECRSLRKQMLEWNNSYKGLSLAACNQAQAAAAKVTGVVDQAAAATAAKEAFLQARAAMQKLIDENKRLTREIPKESIKIVNKLPSSAKLAALVSDAVPISRAKRVFTDAVKDPTKMKNENGRVRPSDVSGPTGAKDPGIKNQMHALERSSDFVKTLLLEKDSHEAAAAEFQSFADRMAGLEQRLSPAGTPPPPSKAGGFDPSSLAALAGPAAGLAAAAMQRTQESGISDTSSIPTPAQPVPNPGSTKLGSNSSSKGTGKVEPPPAKGEEPGSGPFTSPGGFSAFSSDSDSDISSGTGNSLGSGSPLGVSSGGGGTFAPGASGSGEGKEEETSRSISNAAGSPTEEALQGFGGAGGLNFAAGSSNTDSYTNTEESGPMTEILQDMESAIDGENSGLFTDGDTNGAEEGLGTADGDSLFPRVSACYVRALKRGNVLNGLGERDSEIEN